MFVTIAVRYIGQSRLLWTPKYCEKFVSFNVERYTCRRNFQRQFGGIDKREKAERTTTGLRP